MLQLIDQYGHEVIKSERAAIESAIKSGAPTPANIDDWSHIAMESIEDMKTLFVKPFFLWL